MSVRGCSFILPSGRPCRATPLREADRCVFHEPGHAEEVAEARRLGGLRRRRDRTLADVYDFVGLGEAEGIRRLLEIAAFDTLNLEASIARVRALIAAAGAATKLLEVRDLAERVATLESAYRAVGLLPAESRTGDDDRLTEGLEA